MCSNHAPQSRSGGHQHAPAAGQDADGELAECPVMVGSATVKADAEEAGLVRDYQGQRYWLCCEACAPLFDADPERYVHVA